MKGKRKKKNQPFIILLQRHRYFSVSSSPLCICYNKYILHNCNFSAYAVSSKNFDIIS